MKKEVFYFISSFTLEIYFSIVVPSVLQDINSGSFV